MTSEFFEHKDKYESVDIIEPGHGYWVNASSAGQLILSLTDTLSAMNRIRIEPMVEAPPSAPVSDAGTELPQTFSLQQNYPNPFNPTTIISYSLPTSVYVTLKVYDVLGKEVATLVNGTQDAGIKSVNFNTASISGGLPSGMYIYKLNAGTYSAVKKLLLMK